MGILNLRCHFLCYELLFVVVVWHLVSKDMPHFHPHNNGLYVRLSYLYKAPREYNNNKPPRINSKPAGFKNKPPRINSNPGGLKSNP